MIWLSILVSVAGCIYAAPQIDWTKLSSLLLVATLSIADSAAFNHYWERDIDSLMTKTATRSLPAGVVPPLNALVYSLALSATGIALGFFMLGLPPGLFLALGWFLYAVVYTMWLKRRPGLTYRAGLRRQRHLPRGLRPSQGHNRPPGGACLLRHLSSESRRTYGPWPTATDTTTEKQAYRCCRRL